VWSILASTSVDYRLFVISDNSTDGTNEWLTEMKSLGKIDEVIINLENLGSAESFNKVIKSTSSEYFVMACDDMWFHRGWDISSINIFNRFNDCGIVTFFNIPQLKSYDQSTRVDASTHKIQATGLGASMMSRELYTTAGEFSMPTNIKMGYFAGPFCNRADRTTLVRRKQYVTVPEYAVQMDRYNPGGQGKPPLHQEYLYSEYNSRRGVEKKKHIAHNNQAKHSGKRRG
jgi:glycosyltransferase involved in cell wall biosynthesis